MNRGFVIVAQNSTEDYIKCAEILSRSIKNVMPPESVTLITDIETKNSYFNNVIIFPHGDNCKNDNWKLANDWQVYDASPYDYTIKLEADMYIPRDISYWWDVLKNHDLVISDCIRNYKNEISHEKYYRKIFIDNNLPDLYNAITYFKKSDVAKNFFMIVKDIFKNWNAYKKIIKCYDTEKATTDVVYGLAARIIGEENCTLPSFKDMSMIHMKQFINKTYNHDWTKELLYEVDNTVLRVNTIPQMYPFHYHIKKFALNLEDELYG